MISAATFKTAAPTISIEPLPAQTQTQTLTAGQIVKAQVLERLSADKSLISIGGMQMQATTEVAVAPGDVLYFTVRSTEPVVLQLHGMEYRTVNPFSTLDSVVRLLNLTSDRLTSVILSYMISRNQKVSKSDVEELRRMITALRSEGVTGETDEELLDLIVALRSKQLPVTSAYIALARRSASPEDIAALSAELLELLESAQLPEDVKEPILRYFRKQKSAAAAIRHAVETLGIDYEHSLVRWGVGSSDQPKTGSLKAALMRLIAFLETEDKKEAHGALHAAASALVSAVETQQFETLNPPQPGELALQIPVMIDGMLRTLSLSILPHGNHTMFEDAPREFSFRMTIELSELGTVSAMGRLAGRQVSAAIAVESDAHAKKIEEGFDQLIDALRGEGCVPVSLSARQGTAAASSLVRKTVNASA